MNLPGHLAGLLSIFGGVLVSRIVLHKLVSGIVTLGLLLQTIAPAAVYPASSPTSDQTSQPTTSLTAAVASQSSTLSQPISISRVQSSYQTGSSIVISYTVRNNQSAVNLPNVATGLNLTDTVAALSGFDPLADPNTARSVIVSAELTNGAAFLDASIWPDVSGSQLLFPLGDIAPRASATFSVTISTPTAAADFLELDNGATAYGTFQGRAATAVAPPIRLAPDGYETWLASTPDAAREDEAMLFQVAEIGDDPLALFDFVQGLGYEAYSGSLRGTRGTLWSEAGNSADQSSLLIAMLRSSGYPARYRHGALPQAQAQTLIASMFETPTAVRGRVPAGADTSDPLNDPELLGFAQDHWWVEAYLPGSGWVNLDPTIAAAAPGDIIAAPLSDGSDQIAALPDAIRHTLSFTLDVEQYSSFPIGGLSLQQMTVLTATIPTAQTAGVPVNIAFAVESNIQNGMVYATAEHTYTPYLAYGSSPQTIFGTPIQDVLTSFPLASRYTTGIWLEVTATAPDGSSQTYRRTIKDLVGADLRQGGNAQLPPRDNSPLLTSSDLIQVQPIPNSAYPADEVDRIVHSMIQQTPDLVAAYNAYAQLDGTADVDAISAFADDQLPALYQAQFAQLDLMSAMFQFGSTWEERPIRAETTLVKSYPDRPKLILSSQIGAGDGSLETSFELLNISERAIAYPGQNQEAVKSANFLRTSSEKTMEYDLLSLFLPGEVRSAVRTLLAAAEQGIPTRFILAENLGQLDELAIPDMTKAHIAAYANAGSLVSVPERMVSMPYGEDIGFMVIAPDGNTSYINADGYAAAAVTYGILNAQNVIAFLMEGAGFGFIGGFIGYIFTFLGQAFIVITDLPPLKLGDIPGAVAGGASGKGLFLGLVAAATAAIPLPLGACGGSPNPPACQGGVMAGYLFVVNALVAGLVGGALDPSLTDFWVSDLPLPTPTTVSTTTVTAVPTLAGTVSLNVAAGHYWAASSALSGGWTTSQTQAAQFDALTAAAADLSQNGTPLGSGSVTAANGRAQFNGSSQQWTLTVSGAAAGYAPAADGLALTQVGAYDATVTGNPDLTAQLRSSYVTLDNALFTGSLDAAFNSPVSLTGAGTAPAPNFAAAHTLMLDQGRFMVSDIDSGTVTVGGTAVNAQSVALAGYTGGVALSDGGDLDQVAVSGAADFFALTAAADNANAVVNNGVLITPDLLSSYSDTYTVTVSVPDGWTVAAMPGGSAVVTATAKAVPGSANVLVTVQSTQYPDLFASAVVPLTLAANQAVNVAVTPDPLLTVPMGVVQGSDYEFPLTLNHAADGRAEVPGAAFNVIVRNDATAAATFDLTVTGLPAGWAVWSNGSGAQTSVTLAAGAQQAIGLYVVPPDGPLPAVGAAYPFTVTAADQANGSVTDSDSGAFTMPALPFPYLTVNPVRQMATPGELVTVPLTLQNVGNSASSFPITVTVRDNHFSTAVVSPTVLLSTATLDSGALSPAASFTTDLVITTTGSVPGSVFFVEARSAAGEFTPMTMAAVEIVSPESGAIFAAAQSCALPGDDTLPTLIEELAYAVVDLEASCATGDCAPYLRDTVVAAIEEVANRANTLSPGLTAVPPLQTIAADLASHTSIADIGSDITALAAAVGDLDVEICEIAEHSIDISFTPTVAAALASQPITFTLNASNLGAITTTYAFTIELPTGTQTFADTIPAGGSQSYDYPISSPALGTFTLQAEAVAIAPDVQQLISDQADATLRVVDRFVQLTAVSPTPAFVETGVSATVLNIEVSNVANLARNAVAETAVIASSGGISYTGSIPLTIAAGNPRSYELTSLNTSGWQEGVYTVTVNLVDDNGDPIPDGSGQGIFAVGEALVIFQSVSPTIVPPGDITVTTKITTEIREGTIFTTTTTAAAQSAGWVKTGQYLVNSEPYSVISEQDSVISDSLTIDNSQFTIDNSTASAVTLGSAIIRTENDEAGVIYGGSWSGINNSRASSGSFARSNSASDSASFTFNSNWVGVGFIGGTSSGQAEIFIDGVSQEIIDLYRRQDEAISRYYTLPISASHTISVTVLGNSHPNASNSRVNVDFFDIWNGSNLPDGTFEQDDAGRVFLGTSWSSINNGAASGGSYARSSSATAWFPFTGDSVTYQAIAYSNGGWAKVYIDGRFQTTLNLYSPTITTRTLSFDGWGAGPHVLQISSYRGLATMDAFTTPGSAPFFAPPAATGVIRYEEDAPAILYNGEPYTQTSSSWTAISSSYASDGYYLRSNSGGDEIAFDFSGSWVGLGFVGGVNGGEAEIFIDGASQGVVDLYRRQTEIVTVYYDGLINASQTLTVTVLGSKHPNSGNTRVNLDFIDTWDGSLLAEGAFEAELGDEERLFFSPSWSAASNAAASDGAYARSSNSTVWFPFTGDSVSYRALAYAGGGTAKLYIDGRFLTTLYLYNPTAISRTLSLDGLGVGPHVLQVSGYRGNATVDTFATPGSAPFYSPPNFSGVSRYEEDSPLILYNGEPYTQTAGSWSAIAGSSSSRGYYNRSNTAADTISFTFNGRWVSPGFTVGTGSGQAEIFIDGSSQGVVDLYDAADNNRQLIYDSLISATHTLSITLLGTSNISATNSRVNLDYIDVWDGADAADGWYEPFDTYLLDGRVDMSPDWSEASDSRAINGSYYQNGDNAWFRFTGGAVTLLAFSHPNANAEIEVFIDGVSQGVVDLTYTFSDTPLPLNYTGLGAGAHVLRVKGVDRARVDAFEANPTAFYPGLPMVEWWDAAPGGADGVIATVAAGDVNNDGRVEIAVSSNDGNLYLFQGDGSDTGGGTPLLWSYAVGSEPDAPVLVELDGNPGAEIVVSSSDGVYALYNDGTPYWFTDTVKAGFPAGGAAAGNLDADDEAEIVVAAKTSVVIFEADGTIAYQYSNFNDQVLPPVLADLTGDGWLDILVAQPSDDTIYLLNYNQGITPTIEWTYPLTSDISSLRGAPAIANIDNDPEPELIVTSSGFVNAINHDGTLLWSTPIGVGAPGGVSIADTDGDGEVEIITTSQFNNGTIYVLNADGSLLWQAAATDTTSGTSAAAHDLDGDGIWEVIWNGDGMGLVVYNGPDGEIIFNEPLINSITRTDFPVVVDVDNDGRAEILAGDPSGFYVVGYDNVWAEARTVWNQYNYHVTNINDDLTAPPDEPNSWQIHNTYRTQTPLNAFAVYGVALTHTVAITGVTVLTNTFSEAPLANYPQYSWNYTQYWYQPQRTFSFDSVLDNMQPGEARQVAEGTTAVYTLSSGQNNLWLPPLYVSAAHIIGIEPVTQTAAVGGTAVYTLTLSNPAATADTYTLTETGLPNDWGVTLPSSVAVPANSDAQLPVTITVPAAAVPGLATFAITAENGSGGSEPASAFLNVVDGVDVSINPPQQTAAPGTLVTYTLTISNLENIAQTYDLAVTGLVNVTAPAQASVSANSAVSLTMTAVAGSDGPHGFSVTAAATGSGAVDSASAVLVGVGDWAVDVTLLPDTAGGGPGSLVTFTVRLANAGSLADTFDLSASVPSGWSYQFLVNGQPVTAVTLSPGPFNTADLVLAITPDVAAGPANYPVSVTAQAQTTGVADTANGTVALSNRGVQIAFLSGDTAVNPGDTASWQVQVTNSGAAADTFDLLVSGFIAVNAQFDQNSVTLNPGQSQTVQLSVAGLDFAVAQTVPVMAAAQSQTDAAIYDEDSTALTFNDQEGVAVAWQPGQRTVNDTTTAVFMLAITNTGSVNTTYAVNVGAAGAAATANITEITLPPQMTALIPVMVIVPQGGSYNVAAVVDSQSSSVTGTDTAVLIVGGSGLITYLPVILNN